jgi:hypothetical protein
MQEEMLKKFLEAKEGLLKDVAGNMRLGIEAMLHAHMFIVTMHSAPDQAARVATVEKFIDKMKT